MFIRCPPHFLIEQRIIAFNVHYKTYTSGWLVDHPTLLRIPGHPLCKLQFVSKPILYVQKKFIFHGYHGYWYHGYGQHTWYIRDPQEAHESMKGQNGILNGLDQRCTSTITIGIQPNGHICGKIGLQRQSQPSKKSPWFSSGYTYVVFFFKNEFKVIKKRQHIRSIQIIININGSAAR